MVIVCNHFLNDKEVSNNTTLEFFKKEIEAFDYSKRK